jgi:hypothetical protein
MNPFTALKNFSPFHFISLYIFSFCLFFSLILSTRHFTLLCYSHSFTSLAFTFYFLSPSLPPLFCTFLTLVLKIWVLPWEVPIAPSGSWFQSVMDLFTKEYFPMSVKRFSLKDNLFKAQRWAYIPLESTLNTCILSTKFIYVFCAILQTNTCSFIPYTALVCSSL